MSEVDRLLSEAREALANKDFRKADRLVEEGIAILRALDEGHQGQTPLHASISESPLGVNAVLRQSIDAVEDLEIEWVHYGRFIWGEIEPEKGEFNESSLGQMKERIKRYGPSGIKGYITLRSADSSWATEAPSKPGSSAPPKNIDDWSNFVTTVVERFPEVKHWRVENEIIAQKFWSGDEKEYATLLRASYNAIKSADPDAKVISGATTGWAIPMVHEKLRAGNKAQALALYEKLTPEERNPLSPLPRGIRTIPALESYVDKAIARGRVREFYDYLLSKEASQYYDIMDVHIYNPHYVVTEVIGWHYKKMKENGFERPIWITESAGMLYPFSDSVHPIKYAVAALAGNVEKVYYFPAIDFPARPDDPIYANAGLITLEAEKKPVFYNYQLLAARLKHATRVERLDLGANVSAFKFDRKNMKPVFVLWSDGADTEISLVVNATHALVTEATTTATTPEETKVQADDEKVSLTATELPIFVE